MHVPLNLTTVFRYVYRFSVQCNNIRIFQTADELFLYIMMSTPAARCRTQFIRIERHES